MNHIFKTSRWMVLLAVAGSLLSALIAFVYGGAKVVEVVAEVFLKGMTEKAAKGAMIGLIETIDLFLLGTVFYIIALGLYELFIDDSLELPHWLVISSLDDLKGKLISGIVVVMTVYFLGALVNGDGQTDLLRISAAIALIIAALTFFQWVNVKSGH